MTTASDGPEVPQPAADELAEKLRRAREFLDRQGLGALFLWRRDNFAWITCGGDNRIPDTQETGVAGILVTPDRRICLADNIEAPRMRDEELAGTDIEVIDYPWHDSDAARGRVQALLGDLSLSASRVAADTSRPEADFASLPDDFKKLRWQLTAPEIDRYREGAARAAGAVEQAIEALEPGLTEQEISGILDHYIRASGLVCTVNLVAVDDRITSFRHPIPTDRALERHAMLVTCASFGGLICNLTRFVHFGPLPDDLSRRQQAVADIDAAVIFATRPGRTLGEIFADLQHAYAAAGHADEWQNHHQGGSTGYAGREVFAKPGDDTPVLDYQAFAWNPSVRGAKSEDTILITPDGLEILTGHGDDWPTITGHAAKGELPRAGCLVR